ncbi:hypothetical protein ACJMK2_031661 [Sinanodonta woodiana]|uniref:Uncharacterized protein n=1 Tax=Sinanodonta woodiana TaxID=1069815 RepID=A0ABD3X1L0_SINWO
MFVKVNKEDEGIYEIKDSLHRTSTIAFETEADMYDRKDGAWYLEIYVLGADEIMQGYVGGNISMNFKRPIKQYTLYNYEELGALLAGSSCSVLTDSALYGRLRCSIDDSGRMYKITIVNVSQRDAGLYKVASGNNAFGRCFFSIEDSPTCAVHGDNMTIGWFYNQQGIKRTLRVIHPNQGVMMFVNHTNYPQIKSNFQHRLLYSGDILQSFMSFTLLNVRQSDAGLYTIETLHGNTIPGSKELNVEVTCSTGGGMQTTLDDVNTNTSVTKQEVVTVQPMEIQFAEKSETKSSVTPSLIRRHLSRSTLEEGWVSRLTLSNDFLHHTNAAESGIVDTAECSTILLSDIENANQCVHFIPHLDGLRNITDGGILVRHSDDRALDSYSSVYSLAKAVDGVEYSYKCIVDGLDTTHEPHNIQSLHGEDKQRRVLQQCETASFAIPSTIRRPPYMLQSEYTSTHDTISEIKAFSNAMVSQSFTSISTVSAFLDNVWGSTDSLSVHDDDKPCEYCVTNANYTIVRTNPKTLVSCDRAAYYGVLDSCAPLCTLGSAAEYEEHLYKSILNGNDSSFAN